MKREGSAKITKYMISFYSQLVKLKKAQCLEFNGSKVLKEVNCMAK